MITYIYDWRSLLWQMSNNTKKGMICVLYEVTYKRRSDRSEKWTEFKEVCPLSELYDLLKWIERYGDVHKLISVVPFK